MYLSSFAKLRSENVSVHQGSTYLREGTTAYTRPLIAVSKDSSIAVAHQDPTNGIIAIYRKIAVRGEYFLCAEIKSSHSQNGDHCFVSHVDWVRDSEVRHRQHRFVIIKTRQDETRLD